MLHVCPRADGPGSSYTCRWLSACAPQGGPQLVPQQNLARLRQAAASTDAYMGGPVFLEALYLLFYLLCHKMGPLI